MGCPNSKEGGKKKKQAQKEISPNTTPQMPPSMVMVKGHGGSLKKKNGTIPPLSIRGNRPPQPLGADYQKAAIGSLHQSAPTVVKQPAPAVVKQPAEGSVGSAGSKGRSKKHSKRSSSNSSKRRRRSRRRRGSSSSASDLAPPQPASYNYTKSDSPPRRPSSASSTSRRSSQSSASGTYEYTAGTELETYDDLCNRDSLLDTAFHPDKVLRCLIVGATQQGTSLEIPGCSKAIDSSYDALARCGADVTVLRDDIGTNSDQGRRPTYYRVLQEIDEIVRRCANNDTLLIMFIGHCCDVSGMAAFIPSGYDNVSYPDVIGGEEVRSLLLGLPRNCSTVLVLDVPTPSVNSMLPVSSSWHEQYSSESLPACELRIKTPGNKDDGLCGKLALSVGSLVVRERSAAAIRDVPALLHVYNIFKSYRRAHYIPDLGHIDLAVASPSSKLRSIQTSSRHQPRSTTRRSRQQIFSPPIAGSGSGRLNATYLNPLDDLVDDSWVSVNSFNRRP